eukprot:TRINITY_DN6840_c1_g1_i1.p1 TRINITY_DN6840_c1_g1~~TRINITY_DN6840_c1_g1_i1.p1  ORF type:complete len:244 (-),score=83.51 TRINITY_DN6840_c1_g1_i1:216-947(-)
MAMFRDFGSKPGSAGVASQQDEYVDRRERLRRLAMETIDLKSDPYFMKNHLGGFECKLCLTIHSSEASYLAHTQGRRHQTNLLKRKAKEALDRGEASQPLYEAKKKREAKKERAPKIGRPGYRVTKLRDPETKQKSLLFEIQYPNIEEGYQPRHRLMSAYEQKKEVPDTRYQYLVVLAIPYETISFKIPNDDIDRSEGKFYSSWDVESKTFTIQLHFALKEGVDGANERETEESPVGKEGQSA